MRKLLFMLMALLAFVPLNAQNDARATALLDKMSAAYLQADGVTLQFVLTTAEDDESTYEAEGTLLMQGRKFNLSTPDVSVWFDGKTQWSMMEGTGEVNITTPDETELQAINPLALLQLYKQGFQCKLLTQSAAKQSAEVELKPETPDGSLRAIRLTIDTRRHAPLAVTLENENDTRTNIRVTQYKTHQQHAAINFVFDAKSHPDVELIDLR